MMILGIIVYCIVFENSGLRRIFGPKRNEVTGCWRKLCNEDLHNLYTLPNIIRMIKSRRVRWSGHVVRMGRRRMQGKPEGRRPQGRPRCSCVGNIKMDLREMGWCYMNWIDWAQDRDQ
jgi:hypothetical protein